MALMPGASLTLISGPTAEPLSLEEAKLHLRVDTSDEDSSISGFIAAATSYCEGFQNRPYVTQVWEMSLDDWPEKEYIELPLPPLRAVTSVKYKDTTGAETTWATTEYFLDRAKYQGRVHLGYGKSWPTATLLPSGAIAVRFTCGYATPFTVDATANTLTAVGHPYANGDMLRLSNSGGALPGGLAAMTDYYVINVSGNTLQLSATSGESAIDITGAGTGTHFLGETPAKVKQAMKLLIGHYNEHREAVLTGTISKEIEQGVEALLWQDRVM